MTEAEIIPLYQDTLRLARRFPINDAAVDAEDLAQVAWMKALPHLDALPGDERRRYLNAAIRNTAFDAMRRARKRPAASLDQPLAAKEGATLAEFAPDPASLEDEVETREELRAIVAEAEGGDRFAAAALLSMAFDQDYAAARLGVGRSTVGSSTVRYRRRRGRTVHLTPDAVRAIRRALAAGTPRKYLAVRYGKTVDIIDKIATGHIWKEVA